MNRSVQPAGQQPIDMRWQVNALESAANSIFITDRDGDIIWSNPAFARLTGYNPEEVLGRNIRLLKSGKHEPAFYARMWQTILAGNPWQGEITNRGKDGRLLCQHQAITPVRDISGQISHFIAIQRPRTELATGKCQVASELPSHPGSVTDPSELAQSLTFILQGSQIGFWDWDLQSGQVRRNDRCAEIIGLSIAEGQLTVDQWVELIHPEDRPNVRQSLQHHLAGLSPAFQSEYRIRTKTGEYKWVFDCAKVVKRDGNGRPLRMSGTNRDVTARKGREEALRESEQRFRTLSDATFEGIIIHEQGRILEANRAAAEMFGFEPAELIGQSVLNFTDHPSRALIQRNSLAGVDEPYELMGLKKDGERFPIQVRSRRIALPYHGRPAQVTAIRDISQARQDQQRIQALERQKAVEAERTRVARDMHDELGASLTRIKVLSERMEQEATDPNKSVSYAQLISLTSRELADSMDEIVWAVDPHKDRLENLGSYLISYAEQFLGLANLPCRLDVPDVLPDIPISAQVRHNVFLAVKEALNNIVKHAQATEVRLGLIVLKGTSGNKRLRLANSGSLVSGVSLASTCNLQPAICSRPSNRLILRVHDNGAGFGPDCISPDSNGLANMQKRLAAVGGSCVIQSRPGKGTHIRLTVPLSGEGQETTGK